MNEQDAIRLINDHLAGRYTQWDEFGIYFFACMLISLLVAAIVFGLFYHKESSPKEYADRIKKILTYALTAGGITACGYGAYLIFKL